MITIRTILNSQPFTELEVKVLVYLYEELSGNFGETYSNIECKEIAFDLKMKVNSVKGIVGSLVKKGVLETYTHVNFGEKPFDVVFFKEQENMEYEPIKN